MQSLRKLIQQGLIETQATIYKNLNTTRQKTANNIIWAKNVLCTKLSGLLSNNRRTTGMPTYYSTRFLRPNNTEINLNENGKIIDINYYSYLDNPDEQRYLNIFREETSSFIAHNHGINKEEFIKINSQYFYDVSSVAPVTKTQIFNEKFVDTKELWAFVSSI